MTAIGYSRVSSDRQENSMDAQEKRIRAYALLHGIDLVEVEEDSDEFSGDLDRPGVQRVLQMVREKKVDAVIITKLDRLSRSTGDTSDLMELFRKTGVTLIDIAQSIDMTCAIGRFIVNIRAAVAEFEREQIGERTSEGLQNLKLQGYPAGPAPYGLMPQSRTPSEKESKIRKVLLPNQYEQKILKLIVGLREIGTSFALIAKNLNDSGYKTRGGGAWGANSVQRRYADVMKQPVAA